MEKVTFDDLVAQARYLRTSYPGDPTEPLLIFGLADYIITNTVGLKWRNEWLYGQHQDVSEKNRSDRRFFRAEAALRISGENTNADQLLQRFRARRVAENIFNLQSVEGVDRIISDMKEGTMESRYSELQVGGQLYRAGVPFHFNTPSGDKGRDFDIAIKPCGCEVACEVKSKLEETKMSHEGIYSSLQQARSQVPVDSPSYLVLRLPENWIGDPELEEAAERAYKRLFGATGRVAAVIFRWEEYFSEQLGGSDSRKSVVYSRFRIERNEKCRFPDDLYKRW